MRQGAAISVIIPALNEEAAIGRVLEAIPPWVDDVLVVDTGSTDATADIARRAGAHVIDEPRRGYGSACLAGIAVLGAADVVVFLDADFSDDPGEMDRLVDPILRGDAELVIGSRFLGRVEPGSLTPQALFVNRLACLLMRLFWQVRHTDLGPFRAIRLEALRRLRMREADYGWTVEMLVRAVMWDLRVTEVPVSCRRRIGTSKTWGTLRGTVGAGTGILGTIFRAALRGPRLVGPGSDVEHLIVLTRYPEPGATKTRLIPVLGPVGTVALQRQMTTHVLGTARAFAKRRGVEVGVRFVGADERRMREAFGAEFPYREQGRGDLGERMFRAFRTAFRHGAARTVIVGVDCPALTPSILSQAFDVLRSHEIVLGPDNRGGYYLIGARRSLPQLFEDIGWGTSVVFTRTMEIVRRHGLSASVLPTLREVDRPEDLPVWDQAIRRRTR